MFSRRGVLGIYYVLGIWCMFCAVSLAVHPRLNVPSAADMRYLRELAKRSRRNAQVISPNDRDLCPETGDNRPPNRIDTVGRLVALRQAMADANLDAYIIHYGDEHLTSVTDYDGRLQYISGFSGSYGYAVVTRQRAALWTDGRYFLQADQQMDCGWILMKRGETDVPSAETWIRDEVPESGRVGADPKLVSIRRWQDYESALSEKNITMIDMSEDLIDKIWIDDRPARSNNHIDIHDISFAGVTWQKKITDVLAKMDEEGMDALIVTALDQIAWLLNLRGNDRETSPLFDAYAILMESEIRLFLRNKNKLLTPTIAAHLNTPRDGLCRKSGVECVNIREYEDVMNDIRGLSARSDVSKIWVSPGSNYAVYWAAGAKRHVAAEPIPLMKSVKNSVERRRYKECQVRDSAAVCEFAVFLEKEIAKGNVLTELEAAKKLTDIRKTYDYNWGVSFLPISAVGSHAAVIHYRPDNTTDRRLSTTELYLIDSGGQYQDGTTDVTRTFHFGTPTDEEKEAYTRVLLGVIELATTVWPFGLKGSQIDARTRTPLWSRGWDYRHGTGHGIGYFLNVHEGPARIGIGNNPAHSALYDGMFFSDEPGFYKDGQYGIRLETIMEIVKADTPSRFGDVDYLTFRAATLVPFEPKLIITSMLNQKHRRWLNEYNQRCRDEVGPYLQQRKKTEAYDWLRARTDPIPDTPSWELTSTASTSSKRYFFTAIFSICYLLHLSKIWQCA